MTSCKDKNAVTLKEKLQSEYTRSDKVTNLSSGSKVQYMQMEKSINQQYIKELDSLVNTAFVRQLERFEDEELGVLSSYKNGGECAMEIENKNILNRLKRTEGQIRGIQKMIEDEKECMDVITQLSAVRSSIDRVMGMIVADNLKNCFEKPDSNPEEQAAKLEQAIKMIIKK